MIKQGNFYFITNKFYEIYDKDHLLMKNKEKENNNLHDRPCFFAFEDNKNPNIFWCIPISSKTEKYILEYEKKLAKQKSRSVKNPKCTTIFFGDVMGIKRAFLIQNMFPVTEKYISSVYIDKNTKNAVTIDAAAEKEIIKNAKNALKLVRFGNPTIIFADILKIYDALCSESSINLGHIICLNGVTSSGKTSIAKEIQNISEKNYYYVSLDMFEQMANLKYRIKSYYHELNDCVKVMYEAVSSFAKLGKNVILDTIFLDIPEFPNIYERFIEVCAGITIFNIHVTCPLDECKRRNISRKDRIVELSEWQNERMAILPYFLTVDTINKNPTECANEILKQIDFTFYT